MADLGGLTGGGIYGGFLAAEDMSADAARKKYLNDIMQGGDIAYGRTLQSLGALGGMPGGGMPGGGMPGMGAPPMGMPGGMPPGPQMPGRPPMPPGAPPMGGALPPGAPPPGGGGGPAMGPPPGQGGLGPGDTLSPQQIAAANPGGIPQPVAMPPSGGNVGPGMRPPGPPPQMPPPGQMPPQQQPQMPPQGGPGLDWRTILQKTIQANPNTPPQILAAAVDRWIPLMNAASQEQWKEQSLYLRGQQLDIQQQNVDQRLGIAQMIEAGRGERSERAEAGKNWRAQLSADTKQDLGRLSRDARLEVAQLQQEGAFSRANLSAETRKEIEGLKDTTKRELFGEAEAGKERRLATTEAGRDRRADLAAKVKLDTTTLTLKARQEIAQAAVAGQNWRASLSVDTKKEIEKQSEEFKRNLAEYMEAGRMERFEEGRTSKEKIENQRFQMNLQKINTAREQAGLDPFTVDQDGNITTKASAGLSTVEKMSDDMVAGRRPPFVGGYGGLGVPIKMAPSFEKTMAQRHPEFNRSTAALQWEAEKRRAIVMNGPQQVRFRQLEQSVQPFIRELEDLSEKMRLGGMMAWNQAKLEAERQGGNPLVARYDTAFGGIMGEVAQLENGGYAPTDASWKAAYEQLNKARGVRAQMAALDEIKKIISYRVQGMDSIAPGLQPGSENPYAPLPGGGVRPNVDTSGWRIGH
jgi:hypothetical protein